MAKSRSIIWNEVVCVTDTDKGEEWLGYCAGYRLTDGSMNNGDSVLVLVTRDYGMGRVSVPVPLRFCS